MSHHHHRHGTTAVLPWQPLAWSGLELRVPWFYVGGNRFAVPHRSCSQGTASVGVARWLTRTLFVHTSGSAKGRGREAGPDRWASSGRRKDWAEACRGSLKFLERNCATYHRNTSTPFFKRRKGHTGWCLRILPSLCRPKKVCPLSATLQPQKPFRKLFVAQQVPLSVVPVACLYKPAHLPYCEPAWDDTRLGDACRKGLLPSAESHWGRP